MTKTLQEKAMEWVSINMSWDEYEGNWDEAGAKTFVAGYHMAMTEIDQLLKDFGLTIEKKYKLP